MFTYEAVPSELDMAPQSPHLCHVIGCFVLPFSPSLCQVFLSTSKVLRGCSLFHVCQVSWSMIPMKLPCLWVGTWWSTLKESNFLDTPFRLCPIKQLDKCRCLDSFCCSFSLRVPWVWPLHLAWGPLLFMHEESKRLSICLTLHLLFAEKQKK